ncbi:MAG: 3-carboxy-cis,cis-muconate cycloisomerase [Acidimicrobiales bacterium]
MAAAVSDRAWVQAMLDAEAGLVRAEARVGLVPAAHADAIAAACDAARFDIAALGEQAAASGNPVVPLVRALTVAVGGRAAAHVHLGATSQDILDTATMLVARRATGTVLDDLAAAAAVCARLAEEHRSTPMAGRTLLQQALPVTFGLKAAGWLVALDEAAAALGQVRQGRLAVQLGGAAGTLASLDPHGPRVVAELALVLGLAEPTLPWHAHRGRLAELAGALGTAAGVLAKIGRDLVLLAQTEVGEATAGGAGLGGSSTLPHKRNPVDAVLALAATRRVPALVGALLAGLDQEHERAAGAWHAEWETLSDLLRLVGGASARVRDALGRLEVHPGRMRANLDATGGRLLAERVTAALVPRLGRLEAHDLVTSACRRSVDEDRPLAAVLARDPTVAEALGPDRVGSALDELLDPTGYLGASDELVQRALDYHRALDGHWAGGGRS